MSTTEEELALLQGEGERPLCSQPLLRHMAFGEKLLDEPLCPTTPHLAESLIVLACGCNRPVCGAAIHHGQYAYGVAALCRIGHGDTNVLNIRTI